MDSLCELMEWILFNTMFSCVIVIACNLFVIESNDALSYEIIVALIDTISLVGISSLYFYFSERITTNMSEIDNIFYHSAWYRLTPKQQSHLVLPIQRAQREFRLRGLGIFDCSLPVFLSVRYFYNFYEKWAFFATNIDRGQSQI